MEFEWDDAKSQRSERERGLPFDIAMAIFDSWTLEREDRRRDYGERRMVATGLGAGRVLTCVYVDRDQDGRYVRRIISLRPASRRERQDYVDRAQAT